MGGSEQRSERNRLNPNHASLPPPAAKLKTLEARIAEFGESTDVEATDAIRMRLGDLIRAVIEVHAVLISDAADKLDAAARWLVNCYWLTGHGWRRYLAEHSDAAGWGSRMREALAADLRPIQNELRSLLEGIPAGRMSRSNDGYDVGCSICGESAVTFSTGDGSIECVSLSPVNPAPHRQAIETGRLAELLGEGDASAVLQHIASAGGHGCTVYCPDCNRIYCRAHYAVEAVWSGSWHEASYASCPLGHEREFE